MNKKEELPLVSLLVAIRNEANFIGDCLTSIIEQDYPSDRLEVIILDGNSTDNSWEIAENLIVGKDNILLIENPKQIQAAAWNLGLDICKGEIISIVSGHVRLSKDYVSNAVDTLKRTDADLVGGTVRSVSSGFIGDAIAIAMSHPFGVGDASFRFTDIEQETDSVFMGFCYRSIYEKIGKFDEELVRNQDDEFSYRLKKFGGRIVCNPSIKSQYFSRNTISSLWKQYYQYGYWKVRVLQKHPAQMRLRQFVPLAFVLALISTLLLTLMFKWGYILLTLVIGSYVFTNLIVSIKIEAKKGWKFFSIFPLIFLTLHLSYGVGFLIGLFKFWNRWQDKIGKVYPIKAG